MDTSLGKAPRVIRPVEAVHKGSAIQVNKMISLLSATNIELQWIGCIGHPHTEYNNKVFMS